MRTPGGLPFWILARVLVGFIFAYAGLGKLLEPAANFEATLLKYGVFSPGWIPLMARIIPWLEWLLGSLMIVGYLPRLTAAGVSGLSLAFLVTLSSSGLLLESGGADCGCFGRSGFHLSVQQIFLVDLVSLGVSLGMVFSEKFPWSLHSLLVKKNRGRDDIEPRGFSR